MQKFVTDKGTQLTSMSKHPAETATSTVAANNDYDGESGHSEVSEIFTGVLDQNFMLIETLQGFKYT